MKYAPTKHLSSSHPSRALRFALIALVVFSLEVTSHNAYAQDTSPPSTQAKPTRATVLITLNRAREAYLSGLYDDVINLIIPVLEGNPPSITLLKTSEQVDIYRLLGLSLSLDPSRRKEAHSIFLEALKLDASFQLFEGVHPAEAIELVEEARATLTGTSQNPTDKTAAGTVFIERKVIKNQKFLVFLPFGTGQYQNDDTFWFIFFLSTEALSLATNITCFTWVESLRGANGLYTESNRNKAETLQTVQFTAFYAFLAFYGTSVLHAWLNYTPYTTSIRILDGPPPELSQNTPPPKRDAWNVSIGQAPQFFPNAPTGNETITQREDDSWVMQFSLGF